MQEVHVIGGGLAGSEAAWQLAQRGVSVVLFEMRPHRMTPAHHTSDLAELVCSNSLGSFLTSSAGGLLKEELRIFGSLILEAAESVKVPAGGALAVDRHAFAASVTERLEAHPKITIRREEAKFINPEHPTILATGPLTSDAMANSLQAITGREYLHFFDAAAPIVDGSTVDYDKGFWGARYDKGTPDYFNCPMEKEEYLAFYEALISGTTAPIHEGIEDLKVFEGCMPIEEMAKRGVDTLRYGPLRPVGLKGSDGRRPYAVLQLRKENYEGELLNLVGFQTRLKWPEQRRVFRMIPALHSVDFHRYGVMHRNTFLNSPKLLNSCFRFKSHPLCWVAGQLTGVEGYVESTASGFMAGVQAWATLTGKECIEFPATTILGALARHISVENKEYQPMAANFGILPPLEERIRDKQKRKEAYSQRSLADLREMHKLLEY